MNFFNPKPAAKSGAHLDTIDDIYDHTGMFKEEGETNIDIGERKIKGSIADMEMDENIYGSKKVSRK